MKVIIILGATLVSIVILFLISYNFDTGFWGDTPYVSNSYYVFHPHPDDTCEELIFKFNLYHPNGTNPIKFEVLNEIQKRGCN